MENTNKKKNYKNYNKYKKSNKYKSNKNSSTKKTNNTKPVEKDLTKVNKSNKNTEVKTKTTNTSSKTKNINNTKPVEKDLTKINKSNKNSEVKIETKINNKISNGDELSKKVQEYKNDIKNTNSKTDVEKDIKISSKEDISKIINEYKKIKEVDNKNIKEEDTSIEDEIKILDDDELSNIVKSYEEEIKLDSPKKKKKRKVRWNNVFLLFIIIIFLTILIISLTNILNWIKDTKNAEKEIVDIQENTIINEVTDSEETEIIETPIEEEIPKESPYWEYIKMNLIDVDFSDLKNKNSDTVGWIQVNGTNINYPYVQTNNNDYYLTHSFEHSNNSNGWIFMDYRNNKTDFDKNTIIYGHGMINKTMFGTLRKILKNGWLNNSNNHVIKLSTESENTLWQVFSVYKIPTTNDYIQVDFISSEEFVNFGNMLINRSVHNFNTTINEEDKILTLSTCYNDNDKLVLHAKLIKRETK